MRLQALLPLVTWPEPSGESAVANAAAVASALGADLHALALRAEIPPVSNALSRALLDLPRMMREAEALSERNGAALLAAARAKGATTTSAGGPVALLGDVAVAPARCHDITLMGWALGHDGIRQVAEAILFGSGRPLVLLPESRTVPGTFAHVAVAWDGSRVAARALGDARPLIARAGKVSVLTVTGEKPLKEGESGETIVAMLRRSGVSADYVPVPVGGGPIAQTLQEGAAGCGADILVMGGFGHSRLRDFVLGGATAGVFGDLRMPVLLSH